MATTAMGVVEEGPPILKGASDLRSYKLIKLRNGLAALLIHDPQVSLEADDGWRDAPTADADADAALNSDGGSSDVLPWPSMHTCTGIGGVGFNFEAKSRLRFHPDEEGSLKQPGLFHILKTNRDSEVSSTKKAAAAMCVGVGSMADPEDAPGLVHFLEHMLFMGSAKFPDENEYDKFLSKHGGDSNAYTDNEFTCYHFDVRSKCFKDALDRFSQFFIAPLVKAEAMDREIQAIESEFVQAAANDENRLLQLQCYTASASHPAHGFAWGNRKSLGDPMEQGVDMRAKLLRLYHDHYQAARMKLVVLGGESLETLQEWVVELFGGVPTGGTRGRLALHWQGRIWEPGRVYRVAAVCKQSWVSICWPLPCLESEYLRKPQDYLGHLIGHQGAGSLVSLLKNSGWGRRVTAGCGDSGLGTTSLAYMFNVTITLCDIGLDHVMEVVGLLYEYMKMLRLAGPQEWVLREQQAISTLKFQYAEETPPDQYAIGLATNMHIYPEANVLYGEFAYDEWDPGLVASILALLTPANMRLDILSHEFDRNAPGVQMEPWFETPFTVEALPADLVAEWTDPPTLNPALHMPVQNDFIPRNFTIHTGSGSAAASPQCVMDAAAMKVWHKHDVRFKTPRTNAWFSIAGRVASKHVSGAVLAQVYVVLLMSQLNEMLFLSNLAKLETSITLCGYKIQLKMFGFSEKLPVLAQKIACAMTALTVTQGEFDGARSCILEDLRTANENPVQHAAYLATQALSKQFWDVERRAECLRELTLPDFTKFSAALFSKAYIECFLHGNLLKKEALAIAKVFKEALVPRPFPLEERPVNQVVKLPGSTTLLYKENCKRPIERNSVVLSYFQIGPDLGNRSMKLHCLLDLFAHIVSEPFFNELRTQEQLGYTVDSRRHNIHRVLGFTFLVQSAKYSPAYLEARINAFVARIPQMLTRMTDEEFQDHKDSLAGKKLERARSLYEETERHWEQIWQGRYLFDECKRQARELQKVKRNELINWYQRYLGARSTTRRHLCIHVVGRNAQEGNVDDGPGAAAAGAHDTPRRTVSVANLEQYKKQLPVYPPMS